MIEMDFVSYLSAELFDSCLYTFQCFFFTDDLHDLCSTCRCHLFAGNSGADDRDAYFVDAGKFIIEKDKASIGMLQRVFKIGFNRAARIMDQLCEAGIVGGEEGTKPRKILMTPEEFEQYIQNINTTE